MKLTDIRVGQSIPRNRRYRFVGGLQLGGLYERLTSICCLSKAGLLVCKRLYLRSRLMSCLTSNWRIPLRPFLETYNTTLIARAHIVQQKCASKFSGRCYLKIYFALQASDLWAGDPVLILVQTLVSQRWEDGLAVLIAPL